MDFMLDFVVLIILLMAPIIIYALNYICKKNNKGIVSIIVSFFKGIVIFILKVLSFLMCYDIQYIKEIAKDIEDDIMTKDK